MNSFAIYLLAGGKRLSGSDNPSEVQSDIYTTRTKPEPNFIQNLTDSIQIGRAHV